jgi:hypothetical protein
VVAIDVQIASCAHLQIKRRMAGDLIQHVIKKAHASRNFGVTHSIEVNGDRDVGLFCVALDSCAAHEFNGLPKSPFNLGLARGCPIAGLCSNSGRFTPPGTLAVQIGEQTHKIL